MKIIKNFFNLVFFFFFFISVVEKGSLRKILKTFFHLKLFDVVIARIFIKSWKASFEIIRNEAFYRQRFAKLDQAKDFNENKINAKLLHSFDENA